MLDKKIELRPDYTTLQGYLSQIQKKQGNLGVEYDEVAIEYQKQLKKIIDRLTAVTGNEYSEFEVPLYGVNNPHSSCRQKMEMDIYAFKMSGLILRLYGQFFYDERNPLDGTPSTVITSNQNQSQQVDVRLVLDVSNKIDEKLKITENEIEKSFLQKMKGGIENVKNYADLIKLVTSTATEVGLAVEKAFSLIT
jgi:hypothetical protein